MKTSSFLAVILMHLGLGGLAGEGKAAEPVDEMFAAIRPHIPSSRIAQFGGDPSKSLSGKYTPCKDLEKRSGALMRGDLLYLFNNGDYLYLEWTDISPEAIHDQGKWTYKDQLVHLQSDRSIPARDPSSGNKFLPIIYKSGESAEKLYLLSTGHGLSELKKETPNGDDFFFLIHSRERQDTTNLQAISREDFIKKHPTLAPDPQAKDSE